MLFSTLLAKPRVPTLALPQPKLLSLVLLRPWLLQALTLRVGLQLPIDLRPMDLRPMLPSALPRKTPGVPGTMPVAQRGIMDDGSASMSVSYFELELFELFGLIFL
jgi:hypothetical protein